MASRPRSGRDKERAKRASPVGFPASRRDSMGNSSRRKRQNRATSGAKRAASSSGAKRATSSRPQSAADRRADRPVSVFDLLDPKLSPAEVAERVAAEFADHAATGTIARMRLEAGIPAGEIGRAHV